MRGRRTAHSCVRRREPGWWHHSYNEQSNGALAKGVNGLSRGQILRSLPRWSLDHGDWKAKTPTARGQNLDIGGGRRCRSPKSKKTSSGSLKLNFFLGKICGQQSKTSVSSTEIMPNGKPSCSPFRVKKRVRGTSGRGWVKQRRDR